MKITDIRSAYIGTNLTLRVKTDAGIDGFAQMEENHGYFNMQPMVECFKQLLLGCDPTNVEDCMRRIRREGAFKPWGKIVSTLEMAFWDIAGKDAGLPVYKLLGGKVRDRVRVYCTMYRGGDQPHPDLRFVDKPDKRSASGGGRLQLQTPRERAESILYFNETYGFSIVKTALAFHNGAFAALAEKEGLAYNSPKPVPAARHLDNSNGSKLTEKGLHWLVDYVTQVKEIVGDRVGIAFDCGPGLYPKDALKFAKAVEPLEVVWLEDLITGDYTPYNQVQCYRDLNVQTTTTIHTGEQIYLRQNYVDLIEKQAVNVIGPDPADVGGIAELKWIAEYANLHGIHIAPHGIFDGVFGMAALAQVSCTLPNNFIAFEYPQAWPEWWYDIVDGLPEGFFKDGFVTPWDKPGLGVEFNVPKAEKYLLEADKDFFL